MNLIVNPESTDFHCSLVFAEPQIELAGEERRFPLIRQVMKRFLIRLNDIRFNVNSPSNDYLHFSRFYGQAYLDVSFGLEEIEVWFRRIESENQLLEVLSDFFEVIKGISVSIQRMALHQHFSSEGDVQGFLNSIIPNHPEAFGARNSNKGDLGMASLSNNLSFLDDYRRQPGSRFMQVNSSGVNTSAGVSIAARSTAGDSRLTTPSPYALEDAYARRLQIKVESLENEVREIKALLSSAAPEDEKAGTHLTLRDIPYEQAKEEIAAYFKAHNGKAVDAGDLQEALRIDIETCIQVLGELDEEGRIKALSSSESGRIAKEKQMRVSKAI